MASTNTEVSQIRRGLTMINVAVATAFAVMFYWSLMSENSAWHKHRIPLRGNLYEVVNMTNYSRRFRSGDATQFPLHEIKSQLGCYGIPTSAEMTLLEAAATAAHADADSDSGIAYALPILSHLLQRRAVLQTATANDLHDMSVCTCFDEFMGDYLMSKYSIRNSNYMHLVTAWSPQFATGSSGDAKGNKWPAATTTALASNNNMQVMKLFAEVQSALPNHVSPSIHSGAVDNNGYLDEAKRYTNGQGEGEAVVVDDANTEKKIPADALALINKIQPTNLAPGLYSSSAHADLASAGEKVKNFCERVARPVLTVKASAYQWQHARDLYLAIAVLVMAAVLLKLRDAQLGATGWDIGFELILTIIGAITAIAGILHVVQVAETDFYEWPVWTGNDNASAYPMFSQWVFMLVFGGIIALLHLVYIGARVTKEKDNTEYKDKKQRTQLFGNTTRVLWTVIIDVSVIFAVSQLGISTLAQHGVLDAMQVQTAWLVLFSVCCISHIANLMHDFNDATFIERVLATTARTEEINFTVYRSGIIIALLRGTIIFSVIYWWWVYGMSMARTISPFYKNNGLGLVFVVFFIITQLTELLWYLIKKTDYSLKDDAAEKNSNLTKLTSLRSLLNLLLPFAVLVQIFMI